MIIVVNDVNIDSDAFLDMPESSQLLYFHFFGRRDEFKRINNVNALMRACGGNCDDLDELFKHFYIEKPLDFKEIGIAVAKSEV